MPTTKSIVSSTDKSFAYDLDSYEGLPVLVEFFARGAEATSNRKVLKGLATDSKYKGKLGVLRLEVEENPLTPHERAIRGVPTLIVFRGREEVGRVVGTVQRSKLTRFLRPYLQPKKDLPPKKGNSKGIATAAPEAAEYRYRESLCTCP